MKEVTLVFKSGRTASFTVEQFKTFKNSFGFYRGLNMKVQLRQYHSTLV